MIALVFIMWHVFHMHGWFHSSAWLENVAEPLGGAQFKPFSAASTLGAAMQGFVIPCCTRSACLPASFTWPTASGRWASLGACGQLPRPSGGRIGSARRCGSRPCWLLGMSALVRSGHGGRGRQAVIVEDAMYEAKTASGEIERERRQANARTTTVTATR